MFEEENFSLSPIHFFQLSVDCIYAQPATPLPHLGSKHLLPDTAELCHEETFAEVFLGWNAEGVAAQVHVSQPFQRVSYPEVTRGDSVELFFDTRDVKTSGFNTRFCHHFFFLPEAVEGHLAGELTRFRTEDSHPLCDPKDLRVKTQLKRSHYSLKIFIPTQCLHGYDPDQFARLGFTYRINRAGGYPQHFSVTSNEYQLEQQPSLWSSLKLIR